MLTVFMFDLEMTIVDSWDSATPLLKKIARMHGIINNWMTIENLTRQDIRFGIFSFAIDREDEKRQGINMAEIHMQLPISPQFVTCWNELEDLCKFRVDNLQKWELVNLFAKDGMFPMWCNQFPDHNFVLFDDSLTFKNQTIKRDGQTITMIKV